MSADDPKRRRRGHEARPPTPDEEAAGGAFFRAPTRAFQALPTEVLDVGAGAQAPQERGPAQSTRAARLPDSLFDVGSEPPGDFAAPPPTEALTNEEVRRITSRHALLRDEPDGHRPEAFELTNPEPFQVPLDSEERALFEVAREPTHHDLRLGELDGPPSDTSTDVDARRRALDTPVQGELDDDTVAIDHVAGALVPSPSPLFEPTDEDAALPSDPSLEVQPAGPPALPADAAGDRYYEELRDVIGAARVFDPKRPAHLVTDPGFRVDSDESWPEITIPPAPRAAAPTSARRSFPVGLVAFLASVLIVTVGGVGIGFSLSKRGVSLDDVIAAGEELAGGESASGTVDDGAAEEATDGDADPREAPAIDPDGLWRDRSVQVYFANVDDASRAGTDGLADTLLQAFTSALDSDEHARWKIARERPSRGYGFNVSLAVLAADDTDDGGVRVRCALNGVRRHEPGGKVSVTVTAARRPEGSLAGADRGKLTREASRACGFALALEFFARALSAR